MYMDYFGCGEEGEFFGDVECGMQCDCCECESVKMFTIGIFLYHNFLLRLYDKIITFYIAS